MESTDQNSGEELAKIEDRLANYDGPDRMVHFLDYRRAHEERDSRLQLYSTGLVQLDQIVEGFETGEVVVITGPTGNGKTLLADSIGHRMMRTEGVRVAWFSFEVPAMKMTEKYGQVEDAESLPLYIPMSLKAGEFGWVKEKCMEAKIKHGCRAVFIDHLHFIVDMATMQNASLNIGAVMRQLKQEVAIKMNMVVFILAHQKQSTDGEPSIDNIRDSSFIAQEADTVLVVYRANDPVPDELKNNAKIKGYALTYQQGYATVKVEKARRSGAYKKRIGFQKKGHWLEEA